MKKLAIVILATLLLSSCNSADTDTPKKVDRSGLPTYKIGYMICNSENETNDRFHAFTEYLSQQLNANFEMAAIDTTDFLKELDSLHFTHTNSLLYIIMNQFNGVEILATEKKDSLGSYSQGVIIARTNNDTINSIADLKGKTMIFGPTLAPTGFMAQIDLLQQNSLDPENDLSFYTIPRGSFKHEKVVYGVLFEKYDAGALPIGDVENMVNEGRIAADDLKIIAKADPIPYCNFAVTQKVDDDLAQKFKKVIISITKDTTVEYNGEVVKVLDRALVDGFEDSKDSDFDIVRDIAKRTNMPPYQKF
nr:phosphate/phosphite/phosphonate ABC transporter substrate-binding protein [Desulfobulbaceae bacterium]